MTKKISPNGYFLIFVIIGMTVFFVTSLGYEELKVKLMPLLTSGFTILLSLIALVQDMKSGSEATMPTDEEGDVIEDEEKIRTPIGDYFKAFGWVAALIVVVYFFGFLIATPSWMFFYLWKTGTKRWQAIVVGVGLTAILYGVFTMVLQVELFQGVAVKWLKG